MRFHRDYSKLKVGDIVWNVLINYYHLIPENPPKLGVIDAGWTPQSGRLYICGEPIEHYYVGDVVPMPDSIEIDPAHNIKAVET